MSLCVCIAAPQEQLDQIKDLIEENERLSAQLEQQEQEQQEQEQQQHEGQTAQAKFNEQVEKQLAQSHAMNEQLQAQV